LLARLFQRKCEIRIWNLVALSLSLSALLFKLMTLLFISFSFSLHRSRCPSADRMQFGTWEGKNFVFASHLPSILMMMVLF
jgi:hypothetical protein